jgi:predicted GIY-YIG superfamily endonuclease
VKGIFNKMHWVYVLKSSSSGNIYIGETTRLFRRWNEHWTSRGGKITSRDNYDTIIGLYSVGANHSFLTHRENIIKGFGTFKCEKFWGIEENKQIALQIENHIAERFLVDRGITKQDVMGGKYLSETICENFCFSSKHNEYIRDRPTCYCCYPCEVKLSRNKEKIFFCCPIPDWVDDAPDKCNYYQEFEPYRKTREAYINASNNRIRAIDVFKPEL